MDRGLREQKQDKMREPAAARRALTEVGHARQLVCVTRTRRIGSNGRKGPLEALAVPMH